MAQHNHWKTALSATKDCLSPKEMEQLIVEANASHPHVATCPRCQAELAMLRSFESASPLPDEGAAVAWISSQIDQRLEAIKGKADAFSAAASTASWFNRILNLRLLIPATALLAVVVAGLLFVGRPRQPELMADLGRSSIYRSQEIQVIGPSGALLQAPATLRWKPYSGASAYKIEVTEVDGARVWNGTTKADSLEIPQVVHSKMLPGKPLQWRVSAIDDSGKVLASSQIQRFTVSPAAHGRTH